MIVVCPIEEIDVGQVIIAGGPQQLNLAPITPA